MVMLPLLLPHLDRDADELRAIPVAKTEAEEGVRRAAEAREGLDDEPHRVELIEIVRPIFPPRGPLVRGRVVEVTDIRDVHERPVEARLRDPRSVLRPVAIVRGMLRADQ